MLPCLLDVATTADTELMTFSKGTWLLIVGAFWVLGAIAWLAVGRPQRPVFLRRSRARRRIGPADAFLRHPAAQVAGGYVETFGPAANVSPRPLGPDDDPDFLLELGRRIRDSREGLLLRILPHPGPLSSAWMQRLRHNPA